MRILFKNKSKNVLTSLEHCPDDVMSLPDTDRLSVVESSEHAQTD